MNPSKRIVTAFLTTVTSVVLLFAYHTSTAGASSATGETVIRQPAVTGSTAGSTSGSTSGSSGSPSSSGSSSKRSSGSSSTSSSTVTGPVAQTQWGPVQVELTVSGSKVTDVSVVQYPSGNPKDQEINSYALPILIQETLDQQSANIQMVSGATVTSTGYLQSLQAALDQAGI